MKLVFSYGDGEKGELRVEGAADDVAAACGYMISKIYSSMLSANRLLAEGFRFAIMTVVCANDSPVWKEHSNGEGISMVIPVKKTGGGAHD